MTYATANKAALEKVKPEEIAQNKTVFVDAENLGKMVSPSSFSNEARESMSNVPTPCSKKASKAGYAARSVLPKAVCYL